jgi:hypothetical protein
VGAFSGWFKWYFRYDFYNTAEREREYFLVLWVRLVLKRVFPCTLGTFSIKESISLCFGHV